MADFCGLSYETGKTIFSVTVDMEEGTNLRSKVDLASDIVRKVECGEVLEVAGEAWRARCGSMRIRLLDGSGYISIIMANGTPILSPPPMPAVETTTNPPLVTCVTVHARSYRYLAAYRVALKKLGFKGSSDPVSLPSVLTFENEAGVAFADVEAVFNALVEKHLKNDYAFPIPPTHKSPKWYVYENYPRPSTNKNAKWWDYENWMAYKKEIAIWAE
jgi:hypothetical protein